MKCKTCGGSGKIIHDHKPGPIVSMGDGSTMQSIGGYSTELCECRKSLPLRDGKASYWVHGPSVSREWKSLCDYLAVSVDLTPELPVSEDNYPLRRTMENAYYPASIYVAITEGDQVLTSDDLRELAKFLVKCADEVDQLDTPLDAANPQQ